MRFFRYSIVSALARELNFFPRPRLMPKPYVRKTYSLAHGLSKPTPARPVAISRALKSLSFSPVPIVYPKVAAPAAPVRVRELAESTPVFTHTSTYISRSRPQRSRPAMVKSNGGLRGSTATRWR